MRLVSFLLIFCFNSYSCNYPQKLKKGEVHTAKCEAVVLDEPQFIDVSNAKKDLRLLRVKVQSLEDINGLRKNQLERAKDSEDDAYKELRWQKTKGTFLTIGAFILGSLITGFVAKETLK